MIHDVEVTPLKRQYHCVCEHHATCCNRRLNISPQEHELRRCLKMIYKSHGDVVAAGSNKNGAIPPEEVREMMTRAATSILEIHPKYFKSEIVSIRTKMWLVELHDWMVILDKNPFAACVSQSQWEKTVSAIKAVKATGFWDVSIKEQEVVR